MNNKTLKIDAANLKKHIIYLGNLGPRYVGTPGEFHAFSYVHSTFQEMAEKVWIEEFPLIGYYPLKSAIYTEKKEKILSVGQALAYSPVAFNGSCKGEILYVGDGSPYEYVTRKGLNPEGKILLSENMRSFAAYPEAVKMGAVGLISASNIEGAVRVGSVSLDRKPGAIPAIAITKENSEILKNYKEPVEIEIISNVKEIQARNVWARLSSKNKAKKNGRILVMAHYDSFWLGAHASDNATGCSLVLELCRALSKTELPCDIDFVCFSGEELGMYGSKFHFDHNQEKIKNIKAILSIDGIAEIDSAPELGVTEILKETVANIVNELDFPVKKWSIPPRPVSDHRFFEDAGVSTLWLGGLGPRYHTALDKIEAIDTDLLEKFANLGLRFLEKLLSNIDTTDSGNL